MLTAAEQRTIRDGVHRAHGVYMRLVHGERYFDLTSVPDGITWLVVVKDEKGQRFDGAFDGRTVEQELCRLVDGLKKKLEAGGKPS